MVPYVVLGTMPEFRIILVPSYRLPVDIANPIRLYVASNIGVT
jgi:hypothetical protein